MKAFSAAPRSNASADKATSQPVTRRKNPLIRCIVHENTRVPCPVHRESFQQNLIAFIEDIDASSVPAFMPFSLPDSHTDNMAFSTLLLAVSFAFSDQPAITMHQYRQLRSEAKTGSEFRQLATFAEQQAADNRKKAAECQEELDGYLSGATPYPAVPKSPNRLQTLKSLISHYRQTAERWDDAGRKYYAKADTGVQARDQPRAGN